MDQGIDVLLPYDSEKAVKSSIVVIAVRPETNKIDYESVIIKAVRDFGNMVYMANLNGVLLSHKEIVINHYPCQFQFATKGKVAMQNYPEMISRFEEKFSADFASSKIIGSLEAINEYRSEIGKTPEELFSLMVPRKNFLEMYGQTIKKIKDFYIINYDIPAVLQSYSDRTNILIIAIALSDFNFPFYRLNRSIYEHFCKNGVINMIDSVKRSKMEWYNQIRRTYHISHNHIEAMFDLKDYVYDSKKNNISFRDTPLGFKIIETSMFDKDETEKRILHVKKNPLQYIRTKEGRKLVYVINEGSSYSSLKIEEKTIEECLSIFNSIEFIN